MVTQAARMKSPEADQEIGRIIEPVQSETAVEPRQPQFDASWTEVAEIAASPTMRYVHLNVAVAVLMFLDGIVEAIIYSDLSLLAFSAIFVAPFALFAWNLNESETDSTRRWLRISGISCLALAATCIATGISAATSTPRDLACVVMSIAFLGLLASSGRYQLKEAGRAN